MFNPLRLFILFIISQQLLTSRSSHAQTASYFLEQLDSRNGLSNSAVNAILLDNDNLLWIGTWDGLNRYDGNDFYTFNYGNAVTGNNGGTTKQSTRIGNNVIQTITNTPNGDVWITTIEGISKYQRQTGLFSNYGYLTSSNSKLGEQDFKIAINKKGELYSWTLRKGGAKYLPEADSFAAYPFHISSSAVEKMQFDSHDKLWVLLKNDSLLQLENTATGFSSVHSYQLPDSIVDFFHVGDKMYCTTNDGGLYELAATAQLKTKLHTPARGMISYLDHYIISDQLKGIVVLDQQFRPTNFLADQVQALKDMRITSLATGTDAIIWCGTDGNGIIKIYPQNKTFGTIFTAQNNQLTNKSVRAFCNNNSDLWVATKGSGIIIYKDYIQNGEKATVSYINTASGLENNNVYALENGDNQIIYIGTDGKGISIYDQINKKLVGWDAMEHTGQAIHFASIYAIVQMPDSSVWLGTSGYGLIHLQIRRNPSGDFSANTIAQYTYQPDGSGPANDIIYALSVDEQGHLWMACRYGGLSVLNLKTKKFRSIKATNDVGGLSHNDLLALYLDTQKRLWIGTSYGLNQFNTVNSNATHPQFIKYTADNGLPNNTIHAITEDKKGRIWVSTNKGLARIDPATNTIAHYQQADGLQSNEFSDGGVWRNTQGYLFFGGTYGFNYFLPDRIGTNTAKPNLLISGFHIGGVPMNENLYTVIAPEENKTTDHPTPTYTIDRAKGFFELHVKAISYQNAEKCEFTYLLEGLDNSAHYTGNTGKIFYNNLRPGNYTLKIRWSNGEGIWTADRTICTFHVQQFWWLSWPAIIAYCLLIAAITYAITSYRKNKRAIKHKLAIAQALRQKELELHEKQLGFYTNITHELQTPLTLIMGSTERFIENDITTSPRKNYFLALMHQQAAHLTYLVQQLLDFRKAEAGHLHNNYKQTDISLLLQQLSELFIPLSEKQNREFIRCISPNIHGMVDRDKLEKVMFNLLINAFKHASGQEAIVLEVAEANSSSNNNTATNSTLSITVSNGSADIPADQLDQLFDNYYVAAPGKHTLGAGIGLAFTKQLVLLMKGTLTAKSENNIIRFTVNLPIPEMQQTPPAVATTTSVSKEITQEVIKITANPISTTNYIFKSITANPTNTTMASSQETNKMALLESIEKQDKATILVVDDEAAIRYLIRDILKNEYIIYEAASGDEAIEMLKNIIPDLIISDILMPGINGLEFCNRIKNSPSTCHIPFVLLSARSEPEQQNEGYGSGADAYIPKPFQNTHLKIRVTKLLEYRKLLIRLFQKDGLIDYTIEKDLVDVDKKFLSTLTNMIEDNLEDVDFNAAALEKSMNMSRMQLYRKLKSLTQMTPAEFIKHIRLKHAANLLSSTQLTVSEIFYRTGFNNQSYFFREFKKQYQCSPSEYRTR